MSSLLFLRPPVLFCFFKFSEILADDDFSFSCTSYPESLALERLGRQRDLAPRRAALNRFPINIGSAHVHLAHRVQQLLPVSATGAQARQPGDVLSLGQALSAHAQQSRRRPNFKHYVATLLAQTLHAPSELHRL